MNYLVNAIRGAVCGLIATILFSSIVWVGNSISNQEWSSWHFFCQFAGKTFSWLMALCIFVFVFIAYIDSEDNR